VVAVLKDYKLLEKLFCITTDGASNNDTMASSIQRRLGELGIIWDASTNHINCLNHVINLAVQAFLHGLKVVQPDTGTEDEDPESETFLKEPRGSFSRVMEKIRGVAKVSHMSHTNSALNFHLRRFCV
jgi:hypothetical protein